MSPEVVDGGVRVCGEEAAELTGGAVVGEEAVVEVERFADDEEGDGAGERGRDG